MRIEINTDSQSWMYIKSAIREANLKFYLQEQMYTPNKELFVEPRAPEPEGGKLTRGFMVYDGGATIDSKIQEVYAAEIKE